MAQVLENFFSRLPDPLFVQNLTLKLEALKLDAWGNVLNPPGGKGTLTGTFQRGAGLVRSAPPAPGIIGERGQLETLSARPAAPVITSASPEAGGYSPSARPELLNLVLRQVPPQSPNPDTARGTASEPAPAFVAKFTPRAVGLRDLPAREILKATDLASIGLTPKGAVTVKVARVLDLQTLEVRLGDRFFPIPIPDAEGFRPGTALGLRVVPAGEHYVLQVDPEAPATARVTPGQVRPYLPFDRPLSETYTFVKDHLLTHPVVRQVLQGTPLAASLRATLEVLVPPAEKISPDSVHPERIAEVMERSGLDYEARLKERLIQYEAGERTLPEMKSLKGQLMRLVEMLDLARENFAGAAARSLREMMSQIRQTLQHIEFHQVQHAVARQEHQFQPLPLVAQILGHEGDLAIYIRHEGREESGSGQGRKRPYQLVFFLKLSRLGELRIDARVEDRRVQARILAGNPEVVQFIQAQGHQLAAALQGLGFETALSGEVTESTDRDLGEGLAEFVRIDTAQLVDVLT